MTGDFAAPSSGLLRGVDRAAFAVALVERLRDRGVRTGPGEAEAFAAALRSHPPDTRTCLYWTARISLIRRQRDLASFDALFDAVFGAAVPGLDPRARRTPLPGGADDDVLAPTGGHAAAEFGADSGPGLPWVTLPAVVAESETDPSATDPAMPLRLPSALAELAELPFERLRPAELRQLTGWVEALVRNRPTRPSRRTRVAPRGNAVALRATMARARRTGWEPLRLMRTRRRTRPRRLVVLCDVSESMHAQASAYLHLMRALVLAGEAEVFAFGVTATRLTVVLRHRSVDAALEVAAARVPDRFGGTRIATSLRDLQRSHHGELLRGALVLIGSDGWDCDPPESLAAAMARLHRRAHRVIWMNPRVGAPEFAPSVASMAAALPFCDRFLPGDTFASLAGVLRSITDHAL